MRIELDVFEDWYLIRHKGETLQAFRTVEECRAWVADTARVRRALGIPGLGKED